VNVPRAPLARAAASKKVYIYRLEKVLWYRAAISIPLPSLVPSKRCQEEKKIYTKYTRSEREYMVYILS